MPQPRKDWHTAPLAVGVALLPHVLGTIEFFAFNFFTNGPRAGRLLQFRNSRVEVHKTEKEKKGDRRPLLLHEKKKSWLN